MVFILFEPDLLVKWNVVISLNTRKTIDTAIEKKKKKTEQRNAIQADFVAPSLLGDFDTRLDHKCTKFLSSICLVDDLHRTSDA